jgi:hypothetical protein
MIERCEQCGFDGSAWDDVAALARIVELPRLWTDALGDLSGQQLQRRPLPLTWSVAPPRVSDPKFVTKLLDTLAGDHAAELRSLLDEQSAAKERLATLAEDYGAGLMTREEHLAGRRVAARRVETLAREIDRASAAATFTVRPDEIVAAREDADDELRRSWLAALVDHVVLHRATTSGPGNFDPERVEVVWRV